jgi:hypothetical protein
VLFPLVASAKNMEHYIFQLETEVWRITVPSALFRHGASRENDIEKLGSPDAVASNRQKSKEQIVSVHRAVLLNTH